MVVASCALHDPNIEIARRMSQRAELRRLRFLKLLLNNFVEIAVDAADNERLKASIAVLAHRETSACKHRH